MCCTGLHGLAARSCQASACWPAILAPPCAAVHHAWPAPPGAQARMEILKIHASKITKHGDIDYEVGLWACVGRHGAVCQQGWPEGGRSKAAAAASREAASQQCMEL